MSLDIETYPSQLDGLAAIELGVLTHSDRKVRLFVNFDNPEMNRYRDRRTGRFISERQYEQLVGQKPLF